MTRIGTVYSAWNDSSVMPIRLMSVAYFSSYASRARGAVRGRTDRSAGQHDEPARPRTVARGNDRTVAAEVGTCSHRGGLTSALAMLALIRPGTGEAWRSSTRRTPRAGLVERADKYIPNTAYMTHIRRMTLDVAAGRTIPDLARSATAAPSD